MIFEPHDRVSPIDRDPVNIVRTHLPPASRTLIKKFRIPLTDSSQRPPDFAIPVQIEIHRPAFMPRPVSRRTREPSRSSLWHHAGPQNAPATITNATIRKKIRSHISNPPIETAAYKYELMRNSNRRCYNRPSARALSLEQTSNTPSCNNLNTAPLVRVSRHGPIQANTILPIPPFHRDARRKSYA